MSPRPTGISRVRAYSLLALGALAAGSLGAAFDQITVTISREYFTLGKGLPDVALRSHVAWLGFRSALPLGAVVVGVGLLRARALDSFSWAAWVGRVALAILASLILAAGVMSIVDPFDVRPATGGILSPSHATRYLLCWGLHIGAYFGVVAGVGFAYVAAARGTTASGGTSA